MPISTNEISEFETTLRAILSNPESCQEYAELFMEGFLNAMKNPRISKEYNKQVQRASGFNAIVTIMKLLERKITRLEQIGRAHV